MTNKNQNINRKQEQERQKQEQNDNLDEALEDSFPASDPPATSPIVREGPPSRQKRKNAYHSWSSSSSSWNIH
jgi:hypothetical protein